MLSIRIREVESLPFAIPIFKFTVRKGLKARILITIHLHYLDLWKELYTCVKNVRSVEEADVWVTYSDERATEILPVGVDSLHVENRGRDVGALFGLLPYINRPYDYWLKLHSKKSPHQRVHGEKWRQLMYTALAGSKQRVHQCLAVLAHPHIGIVSARERISWSIAGNRLNVARLSRRLGLSKVTDDGSWPSGTMFWARGDVLRAWANTGLTQAAFEPEPYALDGMLGHAWERIVSYHAREKLRLETVGI